MIIIKYCGGLGNQMYQYALACVMEQRYPEHSIKADLNHYHLLKEHNGFELHRVFQIDIAEAERKEIRKIYAGFVPLHFMRKFPLGVREYLVYNLQYKVNKIGKILNKRKSRNLITDLKFNVFNDEVLHLQPFANHYMDGLWQNINYFSGYEKLIKDKFKFRDTLNDRENMLAIQMGECNSVSIHVRRGDFVGKKYDICGKQYYQKAISYMRKELDNPRFFIFTDDRDFVKKEFTFVEYEFVPEYKQERNYMDLLFMSKCRNNIISNSTFSFWGAYLNENEDKIVVCPQFALCDEKAAHEYSVPEKWIKVGKDII